MPKCRVTRFVRCGSPSRTREQELLAKNPSTERLEVRKVFDDISAAALMVPSGGRLMQLAEYVAKSRSHQLLEM